MLRKKKKKDERGKGILPWYTLVESDKLMHIGSYSTEQRPAPAPLGYEKEAGTGVRPRLADAGADYLTFLASRRRSCCRRWIITPPTALGPPDPPWQIVMTMKSSLWGTLCRLESSAVRNGLMVQEFPTRICSDFSTRCGFLVEGAGNTTH